jgi:hypothetical protein
MCGYVDELATSGHSLGDEEFVSYLLAGLDDNFDSVVSTMLARVEPITLADLYSQLLSRELHRGHYSNSQSCSYSSINAAVHGPSGPG